MIDSNTLLPTLIPRLVASTSSLKSTNKATPDALSFQAMAILQGKFLNLSTTTSNPSYSPFPLTSKILHTFFFNLNKWDHYRTKPFLSPLMSLHYTVTFLTTKALKLAVISLTPVKTKHYLLNVSVISLEWYLAWTIFSLTMRISYKFTELQWELVRHPSTQTYSWVNLNNTQSTMLPSSP